RSHFSHMEKRDGRVRLRVQVNQQRAPAFCRNGGGQIDRRGGLPDPALLVRNGDNGSHRRSASARPAPAQPFLIALSPLFCCFFRPSCRPFHDISPSTLVSTTGTGTFVFFAVVMPADRPNGIRKEYVSDLYQCKEKLPAAVENSPPLLSRLSFFGTPYWCTRPRYPPCSFHLFSSSLLKKAFRRHSERSEESLFDQNAKKREIPHFADSVRNDRYGVFQQPAK